ncbi:MAG: hypothetical protein GY870_01785 [archaeon]|nr:hypothetical protein [archaeon]
MTASMQISKEDLLNRAKKHFFSMGVDDGAASLCKSNFRYGLAKIHYAQDHLGIEPNATFISTPDETISRNKQRWYSGYGYGGKLNWNSKPEKLIFIDTKPNACGMLVGGLDEIPQPEDIIKKMNTMLTEDSFIDGLKINWDYQKGNHFIDVFKTKPVNTDKIYPRYMFIIHGSSPELRSETEKGIGLYYDKSKVLMNMSKKIKTPFGPILYIEGDDAKNYLNDFRYAKWFAAEKRKLAAEKIFGHFSIISNPMHQGLIDYNEFLLGAQHITQDPNKLFPLALRSDLPAYLISTLPNLTDDQIEELGFEHRAKDLGVIDRLRHFDTIPHGGGYSLPHINRVESVKEIDYKRYFVCEQEAEESVQIFDDPGQIQFSYRGKKIVHKIEDLNLGTVKVKLMPKFILKV